MGRDYEYAEPPMGWIRGLLWTYKIRPEAESALETRIQGIKEAEGFKEKLGGGISVLSYCFRHTVYSVKIAPDTLCNDPRAKNRCPYFVMHLLMPGTPEVISKRFEEFRARCREIAWHTMRSGVQEELKVEIPDNLYLQ